VHGVTSTELRDNANEGKLHAYLQSRSRGGGSWRSGLRWEHERRISTLRPVGSAMGSEVRWVTGEARTRVARGSSLTLAPLTHFVAFGPRFMPGSMLTKKYQSPRSALTFLTVRGQRAPAVSDRHGVRWKCSCGAVWNALTVDRSQKMLRLIWA
jgi:hypothetical protein